MRGYGRPPAKGTKLRRLLLAMLRPEGVTHHELMLTDDWRDVSKGAISCATAQLINEKGYDIRLVPLSSRDRTGGRGRPGGVYRCVGKMRWDGSYRSFINPKEERP